MTADTAPILTVTMNPALDVTTTVDHLMPREKLRCTEPTREPGGGGINVSRVIRELEGDSLAFVAVGGATGQSLAALLVESGLATDILAVSAETRQSFMVYDRNSETQYRFILPGPTLTAAEWDAALTRLRTQAASAAFLVASGSLPPGSPDDGFWAEVTAVANDAGAKVILDTSGAALKRAVHAPVFVLKLDEEEAVEFLGATPKSNADWVEAARSLRGMVSATHIVITLGKDGAIITTDTGPLRIPSIPVKAMSTVGAGDSFVAAMTLALQRGGAIDEACRFGIAAGAAAVMTPGSALARRQDVERLYASVKS